MVFEIQMEMFNISCTRMFEIMSAIEVLYEMPLYGPSKMGEDYNGQRTNAAGFCPGRIARKSQDHRLTAPPNETELV